MPPAKQYMLYTAMFGWAASLALVTANWVFVGLAVVMIPALVVRVPREERMMIEQFGDQYLEYMKKTSRFFPKS